MLQCVYLMMLSFTQWISPGVGGAANVHASNPVPSTRSGQEHIRHIQLSLWILELCSFCEMQLPPPFAHNTAGATTAAATGPAGSTAAAASSTTTAAAATSSSSVTSAACALSRTQSRCAQWRRSSPRVGSRHSCSSGTRFWVREQSIGGLWREESQFGCNAAGTGGATEQAA